MPDVEIEGLPEHVIERLRARAKKHGRTLSEELREIITTAAEDPPRSIADLRRQAGLRGLESPRSADIVRAGRDSR